MKAILRTELYVKNKVIAMNSPENTTSDIYSI